MLRLFYQYFDSCVRGSFQVESERSLTQFSPNILPIEIWVSIFKSLNALELCRVAQVCKYFGLAASEQSLWRNIYTKFTPISVVIPSSSPLYKVSLKVMYINFTRLKKSLNSFQKADEAKFGLINYRMFQLAYRQEAVLALRNIYLEHLRDLFLEVISTDNLFLANYLLDCLRSNKFVSLSSSEIISLLKFDSIHLKKIALFLKDTDLNHARHFLSELSTFNTKWVSFIDELGKTNFMNEPGNLNYMQLLLWRIYVIALQEKDSGLCEKLAGLGESYFPNSCRTGCLEDFVMVAINNLEKNELSFALGVAAGERGVEERLSGVFGVTVATNDLNRVKLIVEANGGVPELSREGVGSFLFCEAVITLNSVEMAEYLSTLAPVERRYWEHAYRNVRDRRMRAFLDRISASFCILS